VLDGGLAYDETAVNEAEKGAAALQGDVVAIEKELQLPAVSEPEADRAFAASWRTSAPNRKPSRRR